MRAAANSFETRGRQAQVDFAEFRLPWGKRYALVVVLGYSRRLWLPELRAMLAAVMEREGRRDAVIAGLVREAVAALERHAQRS